MRNLRSGSWSVPKDGNAVWENDDARCMHQSGEIRTRVPARFAVADGATDATFSGLWARLVTRSFVRFGVPTSGDDCETEEFLAFFRRLQRRWMRATGQGTGRLNWSAEARVVREGSFCTFAGVEFHLDDQGCEMRWWAIGDACVIVASAKGSVDSFPLKGSWEFSNRSAMVKTRGDFLETHDSDVFFGRRFLKKGDRILLVTDALAEQLLSRRIQGLPNKFLPDWLYVSMSDMEFQEWVAMARIFGMKNDDVTLVMVEVG